tara:strand:+ start:1939 stop:2301 length:363 start_codon:yes stop_codon:yes gene_type:complete
MRTRIVTAQARKRQATNKLKISASKKDDVRYTAEAANRLRENFALRSPKPLNTSLEENKSVPITKTSISTRNIPAFGRENKSSVPKWNRRSVAPSKCIVSATKMNGENNSLMNPPYEKVV